MYRNSFTGGRGHRRRSSFARRIGRVLSDARKWLYRNSRLAILIGGGVVLLTAIVLIVTLVIVPTAKNKAPEGNAPLDAENLEGEDIAEAEQYQQQLESGEIDDETLAGLTGEGLTDSDLVLETEEQPLMVGMICGSGSNAVAEGFGRRAEKLIDEGAGIEAYLVYKVEEGSTYNAQVQDVRSLINRGCAVIVVADVSPLAYDMIVTLASKNDVSVVAVNAPEETGYAVNIKSAGSNAPQELAGFIAANASPGIVETVASSQDFSKSMTGAYSAAFSGKGFTAAAPIAWGAEGYRESFAGRIAERPAALAVEGKIAGAVLEEGAKNGYIGEVFATEANAGIIKKWYSMRNGGLSVTAKVKNEDGTETESTVVSGFNSSCKLVASVGYDKASLGSMACEFAAKLAAGYTLKKEGDIYELPASQPVTDSNLQSYYDKYKDAADDTPVSAQIENTDISAMFNAPVNTEY